MRSCLQFMRREAVLLARSLEDAMFLDDASHSDRDTQVR